LGWAKSQPRRRARDDRPSAKRPAARSAKKVAFLEALDQADLLDADGDLRGDRGGQFAVVGREAAAIGGVDDERAENLTVGQHWHKQRAGLGRSAPQRRPERGLDCTGAARPARLGKFADGHGRRCVANLRRRGVTLQAIAAVEEIDVRALRLQQRQGTRDGDGQQVVERRGSRDDVGQRRQAFEFADAAARRLVEARVDDRRGHQRRRVDHEGRVLLGEDARRFRVQGDHADQLAVGGNQGNRHDRLVLLLLELGEVLDARVLQRVLGDEDRLAVLGHPAGKAFTALHAD
jgi:hypothetical protein